MYTDSWPEAQSEPSTGPSLLRLPTPPPTTVSGTTPTAGAVIDPALEAENSSTSARLGAGVPPKMRRSPVSLLTDSRTEKEETYSPPEAHLQLSSNSADRSTIQPTDMPNSSPSKRSSSPSASVSEDGHARPRSTDEHRGHNVLHHVPSYSYSPMHHGHTPYPNGHHHLPPPPPHMSHHGHYYSHPPPLTHYSYYPPPPPPGHVLPYAHHGHPHQLPPPHSYPVPPPAHLHHPPPAHLQSPHSSHPNSPHSHTLPSPHSQLHGHGQAPSHSQREPYSGAYASGAQGQGGGAYPPPPPSSSNGGKGNIYPSGAGPPTPTGEIIYTEDAATKLSDRVRRRCYNCYTTDTSTWRRSNLNPGKVLCNKCGLFERTHSRPRPDQFPHKRGPLSGPGLRRSGSPSSPNASHNPANAYPLPPSLVPSQSPYPQHQPPSLSHPSPHPHSPYLNNKQPMSLPPPGSLASPTHTTLPPYPHMTLPPPRGTSGSSSTQLPPILYGDKERRLPQIQTWHPHVGHGHANGVREYTSQSQSSSLPSPVGSLHREHRTNGDVRSPIVGERKEVAKRRKEGVKRRMGTGEKRKREEVEDGEDEREGDKRVKEEEMKRGRESEDQQEERGDIDEKMESIKQSEDEEEDEKAAAAAILREDGSEDGEEM